MGVVFFEFVVESALWTNVRIQIPRFPTEMSFFKFSKPQSPAWSSAGEHGAPEPAYAPSDRQPTQGADQAGSRPSVALTALRSQFGAPGGHYHRRPFPRRPPPPPPPVPEGEASAPVELPEGGTIVVRNCSTKRVLQLLIDEFGGRAEDVSGRYFIPAAQDLPRIHEFAKKNGFFVKESLVGKILVLDVMVDRSCRFPGAPRPFDDSGDER